MTRIAIHLLNNDTTPMEDVVRLLMHVFGLKHAQAFELMRQVHRQGRAAVARIAQGEEAAVRGRLDYFISAMSKPVAYEVTDDAPDEAPFVEIAGLRPLEDYVAADARRRSQERHALIVVMGCVLAAAAIAAAIILL